MRGSPSPKPTFRDQAEVGGTGILHRVRRKGGETYRVDMPLKRCPLFLVFLPLLVLVVVTIATRFSAPEQQRREPFQRCEALIVQDIDAAVVRPEVVDLLVERGDPDVFADELDELENVGGGLARLLRLLLCGRGGRSRRGGGQGRRRRETRSISGEPGFRTTCQ